VSQRDAAFREDAEKRVGTTLRDKWRLDELVGVGGMAAVYRARHRNGAEWAVKILHRFGAPDVKNLFLREAWFANRVAHPSVVRIVDDDVTEDGSPFLIMDLVEGTPVDELARIKGGALPVHQVMALSDQLLDVVAAAHDSGVVHRDIKPENIILTPEGKLRLIDFGLARLAHGSPDPEPTNAVGTPAFMAPEQARRRGDLVGPRVDVWAIGATMFTLLTGRTVHVRDTIPELLITTATEQPMPVRRLAPAVPPPLAAVVDRALQLRPDDRWQSAHAMRSALRTAYQTVYGTLPNKPAYAASEPAPAPRRTRRLRRGLRRRVAMAVAALAGALALTVTASALAGRGWVREDAIGPRTATAVTPHCRE
jgi:eukaryotic-like serine/threonine-protein kinase